MHVLLVNHLGGLSLPRKSVVKLTDRPDINIAVNNNTTTTLNLILSPLRRYKSAMML